jgi:hypothetical protein
VAIIYRTFLLLVVAGISIFSVLKHIEKRDRDMRVQDLSDCFQPREFAPGQPPQAVRTHFYQAIAHLHQAQLAERSLGWWRNKEITLDWYVREALKNADVGSEEASLIGTALQNAYYELQRHGTLAFTEGREQLSRGREPTATEGLFAGDPLVIGYLVSPVVLPQLGNHPANFILQPATAWALQQDVPDVSAIGHARRFESAGILPASAVQELREKVNPAPRATVGKKND